MGFLSFLGGLFRGKSRAAPLSTVGVANGGGIEGAFLNGRGLPKWGTRELIAAYKTEPWLRAATQRISRSVASLQWTLYTAVENPISPADQPRNGVVPLFQFRKDRPVRDLQLITGPRELRSQRRDYLQSAGMLRQVTSHPMLDMLQVGLGDVGLGGCSQLKLTQVWLDIKGEGFWFLKRDALGTPIKYLAAPPHWVKAVPTPYSPFFELSYGSFNVKVPPEDVIWFRDPDPENPFGRGTGVGESLGDELETDEYAAKYLKHWFANGAMPSAVIALKNSSPEMVRAAREKWEREHQGPTNNNRVMFAGGEMQSMKLDNTFRDQQIPELRKQQRDTIAQVFGIPPEMMGIIENSNRSTIGAAEWIFAIGVRHPRQESLREELQLQLVPKYDDRLVLDYECVTPVDQAFALDVQKGMPGAFGLNEWRELAGYDPVPEFDGVYPPLFHPGQVGTPVDEPADPEKDPNETEPDADPDDAGRGQPKRADPRWAANGLRTLKRIG